MLTTTNTIVSEFAANDAAAQRGGRRQQLVWNHKHSLDDAPCHQVLESLIELRSLNRQQIGYVLANGCCVLTLHGGQIEYDIYSRRLLCVRFVNLFPNNCA